MLRPARPVPTSTQTWFYALAPAEGIYILSHTGSPQVLMRHYSLMGAQGTALTNCGSAPAKNLKCVSQVGKAYGGWDLISQNCYLLGGQPGLLLNFSRLRLCAEGEAILTCQRGGSEYLVFTDNPWANSMKKKKKKACLKLWEELGGKTKTKTKAKASKQTNKKIPSKPLFSEQNFRINCI